MRRFFSKIILPLLALATVVALMVPPAPKLKLDYRKGAAWKDEALVAKFDFPILKTEAQMIQERLSSSGKVVPYFRFDAGKEERSISALASVVADEERLAVVAGCMRSFYESGIIADDALSSDAEMDFTEGKFYIQKDKRATVASDSEVLKLKDARARISEICPEAADLLEANLVYDPQTTRLVHSEYGGTVSPTMGYVSAGQVIVSQGEIVTAEIAQMLDSYKAEYANLVGVTADARYRIGGIILSVVIVLLLFFAIYFADNSILLDTSRLYYLLTVFALIAVVSLSVIRSNEKFTLLVPFTLSALYLQSFFRNRVIFPSFVFSLLPLLIFASDGTALFVMYLAAGTVAIYMFEFFNKGWRQFVTAGVTFLVLAVVYLGFHLFGVISGSVLQDMLYLFVGSMMTVAFYPLIFIFERIFSLVSQSRLEELCSTSGKLIREMESKAPGTFQHSLQVMNIADAASRSIGANTLLVRAGALYHDIGKIENPLCFVENESLAALDPGMTRYHAGITPLQSAQDILRHVEDGVRIAKKHHLPSVIVDFIRTHHGTATVSFFLRRYLDEGGDPSMTDQFRYGGPTPVSKEQIILMLSDSIEAASRTLKEYTPAAYDEFVEKIVADKMEMGQFVAADITLQELETLKECFKSYLAQMYHERIAYPTKNRNKK